MRLLELYLCCGMDFLKIIDCAEKYYVIKLFRAQSMSIFQCIVYSKKIIEEGDDKDE